MIQTFGAEVKRYMPVSLKQFETLTNEILVEVNKLMLEGEEEGQGKLADGDYMAAVVMSALHALDHKQGIIDMNALFEAVVNRICNRVTYFAVEAIKEKHENTAKGEAVGRELSVVDGSDEDLDQIAHV